MFSAISWTAYLKLILCLTCLYYGFIFIKFFPNEWARFFSPRKRNDSPDHPEPLIVNAAELQPEPLPKGEMSRTLEEQLPILGLMAEICDHVHQLGKKYIADSMPITDLKAGIGQILNDRKYNLIRNSSFKDGMGHYINLVLEITCSLRLDAGELNALWYLSPQGLETSPRIPTGG